MDAITQHHYHNIANGKAVTNENGELSTVKTIIVEIDGREVLIPTVWDGRIIEDVEMAIKFAKDSGIDWPNADPTPEGRAELQAFDDEIHKTMLSDTTPEDARLILEAVYETPSEKPSFDKGGLIVPQIEDSPNYEDTTKWSFTPHKSKLAPEESLRPKDRPDGLGVDTENEQLAFEAYKDMLIQDEWERTHSEGSEKYQYADNKYSLGGLATAQKGITTQEGLVMANKKFQLDQKKADTNGDGKLSKYEELSAEAVQQANVDNPEIDEKNMNCGGMMMPMYDEFSGNAIPLGSTATNVRDDIEAMLSEGEYVLPADVVKWHGLKHIMSMQDEAKMGLMTMSLSGLIQYADSEEEIDEPDEGTEEDVSDDDTLDDVPLEDVDVEYPAVEVVDELASEDTGEEYPEETAMLVKTKKPKMYFTT